MKCDRIASLIEDYHYGELEQPESAEVAAHLQACASCRRVLASLERETTLYENYGAAVEKDLGSSPVLRQGVQPAPAAAGAGVVPGRRGWRDAMGPGHGWAVQAIAAMVLVAVSVAGTLLYVERRQPAESRISQENVALDVTTGDSSLNEALKSIQRAEQDYLKAIQQLNALVEKQKPSLEPRIYAELQVNLRMIDGHIAATRKAYYAHPQDAELALYMLAAYSKKVALLQDLTT
jgi:hypothetical protein